jgi:hypothetical protein
VQLDIIGSSFPQTSTVPTRAETIAELASYTGGEGNPIAERRAGASYDAAVRSFNSALWKFNRKVNDLTLAASTADYDLATDFAAPMRAFLVNASSQECQQVYWMEWGPLKERIQPNTGNGSAPEFYAARNLHETGQVSIWPTPGTTLLYPTLRIYYFRRIARAANDADRLNVPEEVYQAVFQLALAMNIAKANSKASAVTAEYALAAKLRQDVEQAHRDWSDWT